MLPFPSRVEFNLCVFCCKDLSESSLSEPLFWDALKKSGIILQSPSPLLYVNISSEYHFSVTSLRNACGTRLKKGGNGVSDKSQ